MVERFRTKKKEVFVMVAIGTDIVKVDRFLSWQSFSYEQFRRVFSDSELEFCKKENGEYDFVRLASRFAAKEAFFKALSSLLVKLGKTDKEFSFLFLCKHVEVTKTVWAISILKINWEAFEEKICDKLPEVQTDLSISHEKEYAIAFVVLGVIPR